MAIISTNRYYTYSYAYPNGTVFYVGKGTGERIDDHEKEARTKCACSKCQVIRLIWDNGATVQKSIEFNSLSDSEARLREVELIKQYSGPYLVNTHFNLSAKQILPSGESLRMLLIERTSPASNIFVAPQRTFRSLRQRAGLKIAKLAREADISPSSIYRIENGEKVTRELVQAALNVINKRLQASYTLDDLRGLNLYA